MFTRLGPVGKDNHAFLAAIDANAMPLGWIPNPTGPVRALAAAGGRLYAGGDFGFIGADQRVRLAAFDLASQELLPSWVPNVNGSVFALAVAGDVVYVGGNFTQAREHPASPASTRADLAAIRVDGRLLPWNPGSDALGAVHALGIADGHIAVGGDFSTVAGSMRYSFASVDASGTLRD